MDLNAEIAQYKVPMAKSNVTTKPMAKALKSGVVESAARTALVA